MAEKKLLLFDLNGTLLTSEKTVSKARAETMHLCKNMGMTVGYITARSPRKTGLFLKDLP